MLPQPASVRLAPGRAAGKAPALTQQKAQQRQLGRREIVLSLPSGAHEVAHRLVTLIRNPHGRELPRSQQPRQSDGVAPVDLDALARPARHHRGRNHQALCPELLKLSVYAIATSARLVAEGQSHPGTGQGEFADLGMQRLHIHGWVCRCGLIAPEDVGRPVEEMRLPLGDLVGMHIKVLGQLGEGLVALHGGQGHFGLESWRVVPARSLAHGFSCSAAILAVLRQKLHLARCPNSPSQL